MRMSQGSDVLFINISFANIHDVIKGTLQIITYTEFIFMFRRSGQRCSILNESWKCARVNLVQMIKILLFKFAFGNIMHCQTTCLISNSFRHDGD